MNLLATLFLSFVISSTASASEKVYTCTSKAESSHTWETSRMVILGPGFKSEASASSDPFSLAFSVNGDSATLKGNQGQSSLRRIGPDKFLEDTGANQIIWTLIPGSEGSKIPTTLVSQKAYSLMGPVAYTTVFKCD